MKRIMLDIETMSTHNTNALVLSVAAVAFTMNKAGVIFLPPERLWVLNLRQQLAAGRTVMDDTVKFWRDQSYEAKAHWLHPARPPVELDVFQQEFAQEFISPDAEEVIEAWANGIMFDLGNLTSLLGVTPWKYNAAKDARTIYHHIPTVRERPIASICLGPAHEPVTDCKDQAWRLWERWPESDLPNAGTGGVVAETVGE
jgi:hypothetical protein